MWYEISVNLHNTRLFKTDKKSIATESDARAKAKLLREKLPTSEGFSVVVREFRETEIVRHDI